MQTIIHFILVHHFIAKTSTEEQRQIKVFISERISPRQLPLGNTCSIQINLILFITIGSQLRYSTFFTFFPNQDITCIIDEEVLDKLKFNVRALLESSDIKDKELLDLCLDVIYNQNMKALGLHNLVLLYVDWKEKKDAQEAADAEPDAVND